MVTTPVFELNSPSYALGKGSLKALRECLGNASGTPFQARF